jgi:hypothetical protein
MKANLAYFGFRRAQKEVGCCTRMESGRFKTLEQISSLEQGCQIFLGTKYQNEGKYTKFYTITKGRIYTKRPLIYQHFPF